VGVTITGVQREADRAQQFRDALGRSRLALRDERLGDDVADSHARIERTHRVLEHDLEPPAQGPQPPFRTVGDELPVELDGA
jgi:hypothetical protein